MSYDLPNFPPQDWADLPEAWNDDDLEDDSRVSAMAIVALLSGALGLGLGWLIWS